MNSHQQKLKRQLFFILGIVVLTIAAVYLVGLVSNAFQADPNAPVAPSVPGNQGSLSLPK